MDDLQADRPAAVLDSAMDPGLNGAALLSWRRQQLAQGGRSVDLDWLLAMAAGLDWSMLQRLRLEPQRSVALRCPLAHLEALWQRHRREAVPLQYLVGLCPWRDLELAVAPGVLIPRQETELLVELAQACSRGEPSGPWADLGTGSGCLALALARLWPGHAGLAVDASPQALAQAQANLQRGGVAERVQLLQGSWWEPLRPWWGELALVVANPPYIPTAVWMELDPLVKHHEPRQALDGGADGLTAIRAIAAGATTALAPGGWLLLEHHHDQSGAVLRLLAEAGLHQATAHADLEGIRRFATARRPPAAPPVSPDP